MGWLHTHPRRAPWSVSRILLQPKSFGNDDVSYAGNSLDRREHQRVVGTVDGIVEDGRIAVGDVNRPTIRTAECSQAPTDVESHLGVPVR